MAHQSLYRRYRPRRFAEVRGQEPVVRALRNAMRDGRVGHAYLFSGPRGTGKTSTARILAKALNCEHPQDGEPDGECPSCLAIDAGTSYDLQELDAASNNGVDAMRALIERVALGSPGRAKVYILDEVHMLSTAASNTLLKTLEEPPQHVTFVLATTEPHKVLDTIISRTQHFEFHLLPAAELTDYVAWVIKDAGLNVADDAIAHVVRAGAGSARDTLSALDQVAAAGGVSERGESVDHLVDALCDADTALALKTVADAVASGRDPRVFGEELLGRLRDVFLQRMGQPLAQVSDAEGEQVRRWAERLTDRAVTRALEQVGEALLEMRQAPDPRIPLEVALVRITRLDADPSLDALVARVEALERALVADGMPAVPPAADATGEAPHPPIPKRSGADAGDHPGAHPAEAARAVLAAKTTTEASVDAPRGAPVGRTAVAPSTAPPVPRPSAPTTPSTPPQPPTVAPAPVPALTPSTPAAASTGVAAVAPAAPSDAHQGWPDRDTLTLAWADAVLPKLNGLTKALYAAGRFLRVDADAAVFALPNEPHRQKCDPKLGQVEAALAAHFGRPIPLRLVTDPGAGASPEDLPMPGSSPPGDRPGTPHDDEPFDVRDLEDAPPAAASTAERMAKAFPGAELVQGD